MSIANVNQKKVLTSIGPFDHSAVPDSILPSHNPNCTRLNKICQMENYTLNKQKISYAGRDGNLHTPAASHVSALVFVRTTLSSTSQSILSGFQSIVYL